MGAVQIAAAGFTFLPATLQSTGPCLFAEQLKKLGINQESVHCEIDWGDRRDGFRRANKTGIDTFSADCLSCHDGVKAQSITTNIKNNPNKMSSLRGGNYQMVSMDHPIGMDYNLYAAASRDYKPISAINNKMVFVNGKVGCLTCHDPLNPEKSHLVMSDRNSALCLTCHND